MNYNSSRDMFPVEHNDALPGPDILHPFQERAVANCRAALAAGNRRIILPLPTGGGKTVIAASMIRSARAKDKDVLFFAPRRELIKQASRKFHAARISHGVIMAGQSHSIMPRTQIASCDTFLSRVVRRKSVDLPRADLIIADEFHLYDSPTRRSILEMYSGVPIIGLTATPARGNGKGLAGIADVIVECDTYGDLIRDGYLTPPRYFAPSEPDLRAVKLGRDGDYDEGQLEKVMTPLIGDIIENWKRLAYGESTVVFCVTRAHARHVCEEFVKIGVAAEYLDGETHNDEREAILARVDSGETTVLVNVFVATFGLDIPRLKVAVLARPTKSIVLYFQIVGRVLRLFPGKEFSIVIDHSGAVNAHGFIDEAVPWSLDAESTVQERRKAMREEAKAPKEITCAQCKTVFRMRRDCPSCGFAMIPPGLALPIHQAELKEVRNENKEKTWEQKADFYSELRGYAQDKGKSEEWARQKYKEKFRVPPNDAAVKDAPPKPVGEEVRKWITSRNIRYAKRSAKAAATG